MPGSRPPTEHQHPHDESRTRRSGRGDYHDLHRELRRGQGRRLDACPGRRIVGIDPCIPDRVHLRERPHVGQPDGRREQLRLVASRGGEQLVDAGENVGRLLTDRRAGCALARPGPRDRPPLRAPRPGSCAGRNPYVRCSLFPPLVELPTSSRSRFAPAHRVGRRIGLSPPAASPASRALVSPMVRREMHERSRFIACRSRSAVVVGFSAALAPHATSRFQPSPARHVDDADDGRRRTWSQAASGGSIAALNLASNASSRRSASSMLRALTWPKPRIRSGSDAISTAIAWLVWSRSAIRDETTRS